MSKEQLIIAQVRSADTYVLWDVSVEPPKERVVGLLHVEAPKLVGPRGQGGELSSHAEAPYAWEAKEYMRAVVLGGVKCPCLFKAELTTPSGKELGTLVARGTTNVASAAVSAGCCTVKSGSVKKLSAPQQAMFERLQQLEEVARRDGVGLWGTEHDDDEEDEATKNRKKKQPKAPSAPKHSRLCVKVDASTLSDLSDSLAGLVSHFWVDSAPSASLFRGWLPPGGAAPSFDVSPTAPWYWASLTLTGVRVPRLGGNTNWGGNVSAAVLEKTAFAAKRLTDRALLGTQVAVVVEGVDERAGALLVSVLQGSPAPGAAPPANLRCLQELLLENGMARVDDRTAMLSGYADALRRAEQKGQAARAGIWIDWVPPTVLPDVASGDSAAEPAVLPAVFKGTVVVAPFGDIVYVLREDSAVDSDPLRVQLAGIRAGHQVKRTDTSVVWPEFSFEAREAVRRAAIGCSVEVVPDRVLEDKVPDGAEGKAPTPAAAGPRLVANVFLLTSTGERAANLAEFPVAMGFASILGKKVALPKEVAAAAEIAETQRRGLHSTKKVANGDRTFMDHGRFTDRKARQFLSREDASVSLVAGARFSPVTFRAAGIVDSVLSPLRFRIILPDQNCTITLSLAGLIAPQMTAEYADAYAKEALAFTKNIVLHRSVMITVTAVTRVGNLMGSLSVVVPAKYSEYSAAKAVAPPKALATADPIRSAAAGTVILSSVSRALLEAGYACLAPSNRGGADPLQVAEAAAKNAGLYIWRANCLPRQRIEMDNASAAAALNKAASALRVTVDGADGAEFYDYPKSSGAQVVWIDSPTCLYVHFNNAESNQRMAAVNKLTQRAATAFASGSGVVDGKIPKIGDIVVGRYSLDKGLYRAKVLKVVQPLVPTKKKGKAAEESTPAHPPGSLLLFFLDYGNTEIRSPDDYRVVADVVESVGLIVPVAKKIDLALVTPPRASDRTATDSALDVVRTFVESAGSSLVIQRVLTSGAGSRFLVANATFESNSLLQTALVTEGCAIVDEHAADIPDENLSDASSKLVTELSTLVEKLLELQEDALSQRRNAWRLGDFRAAEDEW